MSGGSGDAQSSCSSSAVTTSGGLVTTVSNYVAERPNFSFLLGIKRVKLLFIALNLFSIGTTANCAISSQV